MMQDIYPKIKQKFIKLHSFSLTMPTLASKRCIPCMGGVPALRDDKLRVLLGQLKRGWKLINQHHIEKEFLFKDFKKALDFTNKVGKLAEKEGHHPDLYLAWGKVKVTTWTHKIDGLTESDFILAAKIDLL